MSMSRHLFLSVRKRFLTRQLLCPLDLVALKLVFLTRCGKGVPNLVSSCVEAGFPYKRMVYPNCSHIQVMIFEGYGEETAKDTY